MSDKKHIDRLFQEHLKDLDKAPDPKIWSAIEAKLKEEKKHKRIIPMWWYGSGAAALLLLFLALRLFIFNSNPTTPISPNSNIVNTPNPSNSKDKLPLVIDIDSSDIKIQKKIKENSRVVNNTKSNYNANKNASTQNQETSSLVSKTTKNSSKNNATAIHNYKTKQGPKNSRKPLVNQASKIAKNTSKHTETIKSNTKKVPNSFSKETSTIDSLSIEEAIANTKTSPKKDKNPQKWDIQPNVAPVYYSSIGTGSHLDEQLVNNSKSGEFNTSYGVGIGYAINDKLKIRSGINNLKLSFNINDVITYENASTISINNTKSLENLSTSSEAKNISFFSHASLYTQDSALLNTNNNSSEINQSISYFEVPLELEYNILNKRIGISVIGGFSTFILENNRVYSQGNSARIYIGEATNINTISFSTNLGIGLDYNFSKRLNLNLEPTFKYQLNAFNNTSGEFKPYIIGFYTGLNYKF
ncbi:hypothetical protein [uncultured Formosa sp.]|uniref:hypothetical protein n=1 Tax=uncultured Formosa sp. TaxID=255435 RepID=UPI002608232F|nr:hypothetical protein [uncultured Formosa sp.]